MKKNIIVVDDDIKYQIFFEKTFYRKFSKAEYNLIRYMDYESLIDDVENSKIENVGLIICDLLISCSRFGGLEFIEWVYKTDNVGLFNQIAVHTGIDAVGLKSILYRLDNKNAIVYTATKNQNVLDLLEALKCYIVNEPVAEKLVY